MAALVSDRVLNLAKDPESLYLLIEYLTKPEVREKTIHMKVIQDANGKEEIEIYPIDNNGNKIQVPERRVVMTT